MARMTSRPLYRFPLRSLLEMDLITISVPSYHTFFKAFVLLLAFANLKNLLGVWHVSCDHMRLKIQLKD